MFLIDRSHEQVYIPDDGTVELKGPTRPYGYEARTTVHLTRFLSINGGLTQVTNSFFRSTSPRLYVDSAPHTVASGGITVSRWAGFYASLRYRHVGNYRLDGENARIRAAGLDVLDLAVTRSLRPWIDLQLDVDNLTGKDYYETQNYFESRARPGEAPVHRIHATPGYPFGITAGVTLRLGEN